MSWFKNIFGDKPVSNVTVEPITLAILPFKNETNKEFDYFSDRISIPNFSTTNAERNYAPFISYGSIPYYVSVWQKT